MKDYKRVLILILLFFVAAILSYLAGVYRTNQYWKSIERPRDTVWRDTTIYIPGKDLTGRDTIKIPEYVFVPDTSAVKDSTGLYLQKEQIHYASDSADVWVSGIEPRVDSLKLKFSYPEITILKKDKFNVFLESTTSYNSTLNQSLGLGLTYHKNNWEFTPSVGLGYYSIGLQNQFSYYLQFNVRYNLISL